MDPFWRSDNGETTLTLYQGHVLDVLRQMPAESVHMVVTSPPYWGLRNYHLASQVWRGHEGCEHSWDEPILGQSQSGSLEGCSTASARCVPLIQIGLGTLRRSRRILWNHQGGDPREGRLPGVRGTVGEGDRETSVHDEYSRPRQQEGNHGSKVGIR